MYKQGKYPIVSKKTLAKGIFYIEIYCPHIAKAAKAGQFAQVQADWIATAHTASDNLETLVHRMVRGASLHGLTAIPPRNGRFLRPLLRITREQVETHLAALEQTYVTDSTNLTDDYTRNRIRHHIIPAMQALNPAAERTVSYTLRSLRREDNFLTQQASAAYRCCHTAENTLDGLEQLHPALRFRCIAMLLEECGFSCDAPLLERLGRLVEFVRGCLCRGKTGQTDHRDLSETSGHPGTGTGAAGREPAGLRLGACGTADIPRRIGEKRKCS